MNGIYCHFVGYHCMDGDGGRGGFLELWLFGAIWFAFKYALWPSFGHGQSLVLKLVAKVLFHYYRSCLPPDNPFSLVLYLNFYFIMFYFSLLPLFSFRLSSSSFLPPSSVFLCFRRVPILLMVNGILVATWTTLPCQHLPRQFTSSFLVASLADQSQNILNFESPANAMFIAYKKPFT